MDLISFRDLSKEEVEDYFARAEEMDRQLESGKVEKLDGIVATMFFEPSTRTKLSFQSAAERLGMQIVDFVKRTYPNLKIIGRASDMQHAYEYLKRGDVEFNSDNFESSVQLGIKALTQLGFTRNQAFRAARIFKRYDEEVMHQLFDHHEEDEKKYLSEAKRLANELEELFETEKEQPTIEEDSAWDVTTLREEVIEIYAEIDKAKNQ